MFTLFDFLCDQNAVYKVRYISQAKVVTNTPASELFYQNTKVPVASAMLLWQTCVCVYDKFL